MSCGAVYYVAEVVLTFESVDDILQCAIQTKATKQYLPVVLFMMLGVVLSSFIESVDDSFLACVAVA